MFAVILINIAIAAIAYALTPKPKIPTPTPGEFDVPEPKLGQPIPVVFGEVWLGGASITYYGNPATEPIRSRGGK
jgi:hypothetical protein